MSKCKFRVMDMVWSLLRSDEDEYEDGDSLHIEVDEVEYDFNLEEAKRLHKKLGRLIELMRP